jgi:transposase
MLPQSSSALQPVRRFGVGIDTSRYGHHACLLRHDLQPAGPEFAFAESAQGYQQLRLCLGRVLGDAAGPAHFCIRLDAAGQYADNLLHFLHGLTPTFAGRASFTVSCGDPQRNKNYRAALFGNKKSDAIEARACARFALTENPASVTPLSLEQRVLRQIAGRLQAVVRQRTRLINQFHHLLHLTFPELGLLVKNVAAGWVLELVHRFPTAQRLAAAADSDLANIPYLPERHVATLLERARASVASLSGSLAEELLRDHVRQLRDVGARQKNLEKMLVQAYHALPSTNHLDTIKGFGDVTAAILTAFIVDINRFATPGQLVKFFGVLPIESSSGIDRDGRPRSPKRFVMSPRGNDLVRRYLWCAALSAIRYNPAVRALFARVVARNPKQKAIAVGHAMRKLLHLAFAIWKTGKPFNPEHYPWHTPAHVVLSDSDIPVSLDEEADLEATEPEQATNQAAGHNPETEPERSVVTAARPSSPAIDFAHLKQQLPLARVLDQLGITGTMRGGGEQRRGPCPIHRGDGRGKTFSVHLGDNVFQCFDAKCAKKGDVIDLWASVKGMSLRQAAIDLVNTFALEPTPPRTEKRNG